MKINFQPFLVSQNVSNGTCLVRNTQLAFRAPTWRTNFFRSLNTETKHVRARNIEHLHGLGHSLTEESSRIEMSNGMTVRRTMK